jgi:hypothetical protein
VPRGELRVTGGIEPLERETESAGRASAGEGADEHGCGAESRDRHRTGRRGPTLATDGPAATSFGRLLETGSGREPLREYLLEGLGTSRPRPQDGTEVRVRLGPGDVDRARGLLSELARRPDVCDPLALAATSLDVALQDLRAFVGEYAAPVTVAIDRWDCALVRFAAVVTRRPRSADGDLVFSCRDPA